MAGVAKRKYSLETMRLNKALTACLKKIAEVLPEYYDEEIILQLFKKLYPFEWENLSQRYNRYQEKDNFLVSKGKRRRYFHKSPRRFLLETSKVKHLLSKGQMDRHTRVFDACKQAVAYDEFKQARFNKINKRKEKLASNSKLIQSIEPVFLDILIFSYHRKGSILKEKIEIINEIKRYRSKKTIQFLQKINDSERNNQLRRIAFEHLQFLGVNVTLRKSFKGKEKNYKVESDKFQVTPEELVQRLKENTIQDKKSFDVFLSHSSKDVELIIKIKDLLNARGLSIYCDWISDNDYLKRELAGEYTELVLKARIDQSNSFVLVKTENSISGNNEIKSNWIQMEIDYAEEQAKTMYEIKDTDCIEEQLSKIFDFTKQNKR